MILFHTYNNIYEAINTNNLEERTTIRPYKDLNHVFSTEVEIFMARGLIVLRLQNVKRII